MKVAAHSGFAESPEASTLTSGRSFEEILGRKPVGARVVRAGPVSSLSKIAGAAPLALAVFLSIGPQLAAAAEANDGSVLPFPPTPSASVAAPTLQDSTMVRRAEPNHLSKDAPNILIILLDDVGFGLPDTFGGPIHTPTLSRLANQGISYNAFHTTSICSPTRAACAVPA
jgi:Sulfatase